MKKSKFQKLRKAARASMSPIAEEIRRNLDALPVATERFLRLRQIVGDPKAVPPVPAIIPVSRSCWWQWVAAGRAPKSLKLLGVTVWRESDIQKFMAESAK